MGASATSPSKRGSPSSSGSSSPTPSVESAIVRSGLLLCSPRRRLILPSFELTPPFKPPFLRGYSGQQPASSEGALSPSAVAPQPRELRLWIGSWNAGGGPPYSELTQKALQEWMQLPLVSGRELVGAERAGGEEGGLREWRDLYVIGLQELNTSTKFRTLALHKLGDRLQASPDPTRTLPLPCPYPTPTLPPPCPHPAPTLPPPYPHPTPTVSPP